MKNSFNAFLSRGFDTTLADKLIQGAFTLNKLKLLTKPELHKLGLDKDMINNLFDEKRPPIPISTVMKLLYESKRTCCVCRDNSKGIIIHHINEWSISRSHDEKNLVVLCMNDHDLAHTKKGLTLGLSKQQLHSFKKKWLGDVKLTDAKAILGLATHEYSRWDYFNHNRIFELFLKSNISNFNFRATRKVKELGLIDELGTFGVKNDKSKNQYYSFDYGYMLYFYMAELFNEVLKTLPLIDLTDKYSKQEIISLIRPGTYIAIQAGFYFKDASKTMEGKGQRRFGYYKKNNIKIEFEIDAYETTSTSAWGSHLRGHVTITPICFVKSIIEQEEKLVIKVSCIAIGSYFNESPSRKGITPLVSYRNLSPDDY